MVFIRLFIDFIFEFSLDILFIEIFFIFYINNIIGVVFLRIQNYVEVIVVEIERLMRTNKLRYRRMEADENEVIINSYYFIVGFFYYVIRFVFFNCIFICFIIIYFFNDVQSVNSYKFISDSKRYGGVIYDFKVVFFYFGIVRRRGNGIRYIKDVIQFILGNINNLFDKECVVREVVWILMFFF